MVHLVTIKNVTTEINCIDMILISKDNSMTNQETVEEKEEGNVEDEEIKCAVVYNTSFIHLISQ